MFKLACPSCGAEVAFRSPSSAIAVCEYCRSTLLRDADAVRDVGKMAAVLEDYSPIRIATSGAYAGRNFSVVGRIQLRYDDGFWNEWYILFDDGGTGWLSDASGQYAVTLDTGLAADAPPFGQIVPGGQYRWNEVTYTASDVRTATCSGGEGELPFQLGAGWQARVVDYRQAHNFLTLDFSDGDAPRRYAGKAVTLDTLRCQLLREPEAIAASAGRLPGSVASLACPACGASIAWRPAAAAHLHCPACGALSDASSGTAELMDAARREATQPATLALGEVATIDGQRYTLIGLLRWRAWGSTETWTEYLLFNEKAGFLWLVEGDSGWDKVGVLDTWPESVSASAVRLDNTAFTRLDAYDAEVTYAAGAFNWRVKVGDRVAITDYRSSAGQVLTSERSAHELGWSRPRRVGADVVGGWFGKGGTFAAAQAKPAGRDAGTDEDAAPLQRLGLIATGVLLLLNVPIALFGRGEGAWGVIVIALILLWLPLKNFPLDDDA